VLTVFTDDMLLVYIPGYFILVIDATLQRSLSVVLSLTGSQLATALPSQKTIQGGNLTMANVAPFATMTDQKLKSQSPSYL